MIAREASKSDSPSEQTVAEAAAWISRLHGSRRSAEVEAGFRDWLAADEEHARAFEGMTEIWDMMPAMPAAEMPRIAAPWKKEALPQPWGIAAAAALVVTGVTAGFFLFPRDPVYVTEIGEQRIVNLDDGTRVSLNSATRMVVRYDETQRGIELKGGEAFFEVAHQAGRPFVVMAGDHQVRALGTSFAVRYEGSRIAVTLVDGKVDVAPISPSPSSIALTPGQRLTFTRNHEPQIDQPRVAVVTAWRRGEVIFDEMALADAVAEMNRYDKTALVIDDPAIAAMPVSGIYRTGDSPGFAQVVAQMYGLNVAQEDGRIHLRH